MTTYVTPIDGRTISRRRLADRALATGEPMPLVLGAEGDTPKWLKGLQAGFNTVAFGIDRFATALGPGEEEPPRPEDREGLSLGQIVLGGVIAAGTIYGASRLMRRKRRRR